MPGTVFTAAVMPVLAGVLSGFLYGQFVGIEHAPMPASGDVGPSATAADSFRGRFEGPIRVRTSLGAIAVAAALPTVLMGVLAFTIAQIGLDSGAPRLLVLALPAQIFLSALLASLIPSGIFVLVVHHLARAWA